MEVTRKDMLQRNVYNKLDNLVKIIKSKTQLALERNQKEKILKLITLVIVTFQLDNLYTESLDKSGIISLLKIFGIEEGKAEKIKQKCSKGVNIALLAILIFKNLR